MTLESPKMTPIPNPTPNHTINTPRKSRKSPPIFVPIEKLVRITMNRSKQHHGHDGRYPTKPPPWIYKITRQTTLNDPANTSNHPRIFLHAKCEDATISSYNATTPLPPITPKHHPMLHNASITFTNYPHTVTITPFPITPPTTTLNNTFTSLHSTIHPTTPDAPHDHHHYRKALPTQNTFTRHPSDSEQCNLQLPTDYNNPNRHPSEWILRNTRHTSDPPQLRTTPIL